MKMKSGLIICGSVIRAQIKAAGLTHTDVEEQGFIDQFGVFLSREEAWEVANAVGQIFRKVSGEGTLYSENLY